MSAENIGIVLSVSLSLSTTTTPNLVILSSTKELDKANTILKGKIVNQLLVDISLSLIT